MRIPVPTLCQVQLDIRLTNRIGTFYHITLVIISTNRHELEGHSIVDSNRTLVLHACILIARTAAICCVIDNSTFRLTRERNGLTTIYSSSADARSYRSLHSLQLHRINHIDERSSLQVGIHERVVDSRSTIEFAIDSECSLTVGIECYLLNVSCGNHVRCRNNGKLLAHSCIRRNSSNGNFLLTIVLHIELGLNQQFANLLLHIKFLLECLSHWYACVAVHACRDNDVSLVEVSERVCSKLHLGCVLGCAAFDGNLLVQHLDFSIGDERFFLTVYYLQIDVLAVE